MRSPIGRRNAALVALSAGVLITAGCGWGGGSGGGGGDGGQSAPSGKDLHFQAVAAPGPDPFTSSTAAAQPVPVVPRAAAAPAERGARGAAGPEAPQGREGARGATAGTRTPRALPGSTPGLYGGSPSASCDVERQVALLAGDPAKARAFARGAALGQAPVPDFLRGLTPVVVRADVRVTAHGYRDGAASAFQSVLQAGTAVMVDAYGMPRVRCAGGSPLGAPVAAQGSVRYRGKPWRGYDANRVVVVHRAPRPLDALVIVDLVDHAWIERRIGTDGGEDRTPGTPPPYAPDADITDPEAVKAPGAVTSGTVTGRAESAPPGGGASPSGAPDRQGRPAVPDEPQVPADEVELMPEADPGGGPGGVPPGGDDLAPPADEPLPPEPDVPPEPGAPVLPDEPAGTDAFPG
ncbi:DUF6777 domain-containing protein [Streptomyces sp. NPDC059092]|uniref:DUF6777 domain-containing protein n=1 Tax=Streptomyces sp. NPDC059092 TaxID=3346725 RepID=UPI00367E49DB